MAQLPEKIKWSFSASLELVEIHEYLTENSSKQSADKYIDGILKTVDKLVLNPERYSYCRSPKLQKAKIRCINYKKKHIIFYQIKGGIEILAVIHAKRNPELFDGIIS